MKRRIISLMLIGMLLFLTSASQIYAKPEQDKEGTSSKTSVPDGEYVDGTVLVSIASPSSPSLARKGKVAFDKELFVEESYQLGNASALAQTEEQKDFLSDKTFYLSEVSSDSYSTTELIEKLENTAYVVTVEPDYVQYMDSVSEDAYSDEQWYLDAGGSYSGSSSGISYSSAKSKTKSGTPVIAVMDTGIDYNHEDLKDHMWVNSTLTLGGIHGYDFIENTPYCMDFIGHGTHCAGVIAAASDNQKGIAGISTAKLMALKVFDYDGITSNSAIIQALNYIIQAKNAGVNIIAVNCSWGGGSSGFIMPALIQQIGASGTLFIFAAGNDGINHNIAELSCPYDLYHGINSAETKNYLIITGASDPDDMPCDFSDYGSTDVDLFAPGDRIFSTYTEDTYFPGIYDADTESALTSSYLTLDNVKETERLYTGEQIGIHSDTSSSLSYETGKDCKNSPNSGSLKWSVNLGNTPSHSEKSTFLYLDVTDMEPDTEQDYYVSMLFGSTSSDHFFTWEHVVKESSGPDGTDENRFYTTSDGKIYFKVIELVSSAKATGNYEYYIDDIGISVANPDTSLFGSYDIMTGTSMAAPMVTGAVALLGEVYPNDSMADRKNRLLTCVRTTLELSGKCSTGGILDLSKMDDYVASPPDTNENESQKNPDNSSNKNNSGNVSVKKVTLSPTAQKTYTTAKKTTSGKVKKIIKTKTIKLKKKVTLNAGDKLKLKARISPSNATKKTIRWSSSKKKWASVTKKGVVTAKKKGRGHTVKITAAATDGSGKKATCKISIRK